jgi:hypothetical protein
MSQSDGSVSRGLHEQVGSGGEAQMDDVGFDEFLRKMQEEVRTIAAPSEEAPVHILFAPLRRESMP